MSPTAWDTLSRLLPACGHWLEHHRLPAALLAAGVMIAIAYWLTTIRPYFTAARSSADRARIVTPGLGGEPVPFPAARLLRQPVPSPFGRWLLPHLVRRNMTQSELAAELGRPVAVIHALMYGEPVGHALPSLHVVDAICDLLQLDRAEGRAAFFAMAGERLRGDHVSRH